MRATLVGNPNAGRGQGEHALAVARRALSAEGWQLTVVRTQRAGQALAAARKAVQQDQEAVIVVGGDGTINEVVNALAGTNVALGIVPAGTGNVFAREIRLPYNPEEACRILLSCEPVELDLGRISFPNGKDTANERYFLSMAGIGFDAKVVQAVAETTKAKWGVWAYVLTVMKEAWQPPVSHLKMSLDEETIEADGWLLLLANVASYAWRLKICPEAKMDDGLLNLCLFSQCGTLGYLRQFFGTVIRTHPVMAGTLPRRFRKAVIEADPPLLVQMDGDLHGVTPISVSVAPRALRFLAPAKLAPWKR